MEKIVLIFLLLLAAALPSLEGRSFTLEEPTAKWTAVVEGLRNAAPIRSRFNEERSNPFHRHSRQFEGTIRWDSKLGLSISYEDANPVVVNITEDALYISKEGETRNLAFESEQSQVMTLFSRLFSWDVDWLSGNFDTAGEMDEASNWTLKLAPIDEEMTAFINRLTLEGTADYLTRITMDLRGGRAIRISLSQQQHHACFSDDELEEAYPYLNE